MMASSITARGNIEGGLVTLRFIYREHFVLRIIRGTESVQGCASARDPLDVQCAADHPADGRARPL